MLAKTFIVALVIAVSVVCALLSTQVEANKYKKLEQCQNKNQDLAACQFCCAREEGGVLGASAKLRGQACLCIVPSWKSRAMNKFGF